MMPFLFTVQISIILIFALIAASINAQTSSNSSYIGYSLTSTGDPGSVIYSTDDTNPNVSTIPPPDVYLNATVYVGEIDLLVANLTAKVNLDAQVLNLLKFSAGVDVTVDRVSLLIQNVSAKVLLEARLENLVMMINDTLSSLDLNPVLATLGQDVGSLVNTTVSGLTGATSAVVPRSYDLSHNILYSINDYTGNTHTNRILTQSGSIIDESLDNDGHTYKEVTVGSYLQDMTFNGYNETVVVNGQTAQELEYVYAPYNGLMVLSAIYVDAAGAVVATQVLSESSAGGGSTIGGL